MGPNPLYTETFLKTWTFPGTMGLPRYLEKLESGPSKFSHVGPVRVANGRSELGP